MVKYSATTGKPVFLLPTLRSAYLQLGLPSFLLSRWCQLSDPVGQQQCFLCNPPNDLVYASSEHGIALCGLGPLSDGYSVVASREHVGSVADLSPRCPEFLQFANHVRSFLSSEFGSCIVTEHGRVPVCVDVSGTSDAHCFHAHLLFFAGVPDITAAAVPYFAKKQQYGTLEEAAAAAKDNSEYFLVSGSPARASVLTRPGRLIRQFARVLVADAIGKPELTNWRTRPQRHQAVAEAARLRAKWSLTND